MTFPSKVTLKSNDILLLSNVKNEEIGEVGIYENNAFMLELISYDGFIGYLHNKGEENIIIEKLGELLDDFSGLTTGMQIAIDDYGYEE